MFNVSREELVMAYLHGETEKILNVLVIIAILLERTP
jgi:hypothetical protein